MAGSHPELDAALRKLDEELDEGDITQKGYEKRRTRLLSQYLRPQDLPTPPGQAQRGGLRVHSPDDSDHPASNAGSRAASLAALTANEGDGPRLRQVSSIRDGEDYRSQSPQSHVGRFQESQTGNSMRQSSLSGSSHDPRQETLLPPAPATNLEPTPSYETITPSIQIHSRIMDVLIHETLQWLTNNTSQILPGNNEKITKRRMVVERTDTL